MHDFSVRRGEFDLLRILRFLQTANELAFPAQQNRQAFGIPLGLRQFRLHLGQLDIRECTGHCLHRTRSLVIAASAEVVSLGPELRVFHPQRVRDRDGLSPGVLRLREQVMVRM